MPLPALKNWDSTRIGLHQAAQVIGGVRRAVAETEPNWTHLGLQVVPQGVTTGPLPAIGSLLLDFTTQSIVYHADSAVPISISIAGHTQSGLADIVDHTLADVGKTVRIDLSKIQGQSPLSLDSTLASDYAQSLNVIAAALARLRQSLPRETSHLIVWPHGFDASFLWFATSETTEKAPHMNFGFSPGSEGFPRPYIYFYAWPLPQGLLDIRLPEGVRWHQGHWTGAVLDYDTLITTENPGERIFAAFHQIYSQAAPLLKQTTDSR